MKIINIFFALIFSFITTNTRQKAYTPAKSNRYEKIINSQWTFNYFPDKSFDKGFEAPGIDDSKWTAISIPHTWSTFETTGEIHPYIRNAAESDNPYWWIGWGWYRKHFTVNKEYINRKVFIEFEGVQKYCKVWMNGKYLGDHKGGYGSFDFDITQYIKPGEDNVLAVAVNNKTNDEFKIPPMAAGNFDVYGGIYRDVTLVLKDNLYIPMQGSASHEGGTFVTTPEVSERKGVVRVQTWVKNDNNSSKKCTLKTIITDGSGTVVAQMISNAAVKAGELYRFDQTSRLVKNPRLWSNKDPYLYKVYSEVIDGKAIVDSYVSPLGFRWFIWDYKENFLYVNGKKMVIHGGNRHQEYPWLGDAIPKWITEMDYYDMAVNLNYNFMRTAHYPNDKLVYELADKYGIAIDEESPGIKNQLFSAEVQEQQMKEMIRRDRNHPSIMFWSMGNETNHAVDSNCDTVELFVNGSSLGFQYPGETNFHNITFKNILIENGSITASGRKDGQIVKTQVVMAGDPAKIILTASHNRITAARSSLAIIKADIVDAQGNHIYGATNTVKWNVSGPSDLVGPDIYESDINKHHQMDGTMYTDMPVANLVRSNGVPGKIKITASASGLASGSIELVADEIKQDNSVIIEPALNNAGRLNVIKNNKTEIKVISVPEEMKQTVDEFNLKPAGKQEYIDIIRNYILKNNTNLDSSLIEFKTIIDLFSSQMVNNSGRLIADDYNFSVDHFNKCREILRNVDNTGLPEAFRTGLKRYYVQSIISRGMEKNIPEEQKWLKSIPVDGNIVFVQDKNALVAGMGGVITYEVELAGIVGIIHPEFKNLPDQTKEKILAYVSSINPYILTSYKSEQRREGDKRKVTNIFYTVEKGQPVWIPAMKDLK